MRWLLYLSIIIVSLGFRVAQAAESPLTFKLAPQLAGEILGRHLLLLEDVERSLSVDEVLSMEDQAFRRSKQSIPNFGFNRANMWVRFYLNNPGPKPLRVVLEYGYPSTDELDFYYHDKTGKVKTRLNGDRRPLSQRDIAYRLPSFQILVPPGEHAYHMRVQTEGIIRIPLKIWTVNRFQDKRSNEMAFLAFLYGFLFVMMFYNIFVAMMTQNKGYIYYVLFIAVSIVHHAGSQALFVTFFPSRWAILLNNEIYIAATGLGATFASLFTISFLSLQKRLRAVYLILMTTAGIGVLVSVITPFTYNLGARISTVTALIVSLSILAASIISCMQKYRPAYFFMLAWLISIVGTLASNLSNSELLGVNFFTTWGGFVGIAVEVVLLSLAMGDKMKLAVENSARAIQELNESLERKVEEKTRDIRSIMANIKLGIFTIVSADLVVDREYSVNLEEILGEEKLAGRPALDILFSKSSLTNNERSMVESALLCAIGEEPFQFEVNAESLVHEIHIRNGNNAVRTIEIDWSIMLTYNGLIEKILVTCKDVTDLRHFQDALKSRQKELDYIGELVSNSAAKTEKFLHTTERFFDENRRLIQQVQSSSADTLKILFINMHTVKGSARSLGFRDLATAAHEAEQNLADIQKGKIVWNSVILSRDLDVLGDLLATYRKINQIKLGRNQKDLDMVQLERSEFQDELTLLQAMTKVSDVHVIRSGIVRLRNRIMERVFHSAQGFFQEATNGIPQLATDLGKAVPKLRIDADPIVFFTETVEVLQAAFIHILRNALDHGIETVEERLALGKTPEGNIEIVARAGSDGLMISVKDDGRGLAIRRIESLAIEKGLLVAHHSLTSTQIAQLVFESGFSTKDRISDISGRGVGIAAVRQFLGSIGGQVYIELASRDASADQAFLPFRLVLHLPVNKDSFMDLAETA